MKSRLATPYGEVRLSEPSPQLIAIDCESDNGAYFAQGYSAGHRRLWQLDLTRRVAAGELSALLGASTLRTDRFQRKLGLRTLARREMARDAGSAQAAHIAAYVDGINRALDDMRVLPAEFLMLAACPARFSVEDVYLIAELKYFINSAWQFELFHSLAAGRLGAAQASQLFATTGSDGAVFDPLPRALDGEFAEALAHTLAAGLAGLDKLGLASPDIGSNAWAVRASRSASGAPLLASDPHMGNVNPGYNLLYRIRSGERLRVFGSNFPGAPGIIVGRNRHCAWGMTGIMADNQDLYWGALEGGAVRVAGTRQTLDAEETTIAVRGGKSETHVAHGFALGRTVLAREDCALFLRWPALDQPIGGISLHGLSCAHDWQSFRAGLAEMTNSPTMAIYADSDDNIGMQAVGLVPRRAHDVGSLVLSFDEPAHAWQGYVEFDELPCVFNPPEGWVGYANQYDGALFGARAPLSNRWHPPARAWRMRELIEARACHDAASFISMQDDRTDVFAREALPLLRGLAPACAPLDVWHGDTRDTACALLFEQWLVCLGEALLAPALGAELAARYFDLWPAHRWNVLHILREHAAAWRVEDAATLARAALERARAVADTHAQVSFRHTLRRHPLGRLFAASYAYDGGSRETLHAARRNSDFLTASQSGKTPEGYSFGPSFKLVMELGPESRTHYLANMPSSGNPFGGGLRATLRRWQRGERFVDELGPA